MSSRRAATAILWTPLVVAVLASGCGTRGKAAGTTPTITNGAEHTSTAAPDPDAPAAPADGPTATPTGPAAATDDDGWSDPCAEP